MPNLKLSTNVLYVFIPQSQSSLHVVVGYRSRPGLSFFEDCPGLAILCSITACGPAGGSHRL